MKKLFPIPDLLVIDTETGGLDHEQHDLVELAAVRLDARTLERRGQMEARILPLLPVSAKAREMNGYNEEEWSRTAVQCGTALERLNPLLENAMILGKNPDFDWRFLSAASRLHRIPLAKRASHRMIDVTALAWPLMVAGEVAHVGLDHLAEYFDVPGAAHRAMGDVERTIGVYAELLKIWLPAAEGYAHVRFTPQDKGDL